MDNQFLVTDLLIKPVEAEETKMNEDKIGTFKKIRAAICHNCPLCKHARENPQSVIGKILHHKLHADHCPMWKAEQEVYGKEV